MSKHESISFNPWTRSHGPKRILIIRIHAIGDVAITLPYCLALRKQFPNSQIDFLTTASTESLVNAANIFDQIHTFPFCKNRRERIRQAVTLSYIMRNYRYDLIIDLQRNWITRLIRTVSSPESWSEFDRFSMKPAGDRTLETFHRIGFNDLQPNYNLDIKPEFSRKAKSLLLNHGWDGITPLVVFNPAGLWETRNWQVENYVQLAKLWLQEEQVRFLFLGTERILDKVRFIQQQLEHCTINLVNTTTLGEALAVLQFTSCMISEDSGLMHMAWISGVPTIALFGSTNHVWSTPLGNHSQCLHSGDLPCGACMESTCRFGDVHCLTRYTPETVFETAQQLMRIHKKEIVIS